MKVITSLYQSYLEMLPLVEKLKQRVDMIITGQKKPRWHYESRIKLIESYALKMETGRISNPKEMEDLFGCTIVVENHSSIDSAIELVKQVFVEEYRRPKNKDFTHKAPESFDFDDLRLYVKLKEDPSLPATELTTIVFEIQIRTFLQHAWTIATHDLIYKNDDMSWAKQRIAFQIKAMLEHAELSIGSVEHLSLVPEVSKQNKALQELISAKKLVEELWGKEDLPQDMIRLSKNVNAVVRSLKLNFAELKDVLVRETALGKGTCIKNLSPFLIILKSIHNQLPDKFAAYLQDESARFQLFLPKELEFDEQV